MEGERGHGACLYLLMNRKLADEFIKWRARTREGGATHPPQGHSALLQWMECLKQALHSHSHQLYESDLQAAVAHKGQPQAAGRTDSQVPEVYNPAAADSHILGKAVLGEAGHLAVVDILEGKRLAVAKTLDLAEAQIDLCWGNKSRVRSQLQKQTAGLVVD